ncbi:extracellular solute-binding protein [Treponema phagedenis]|uniref:extracellular solute-binding protein n=1 Tax=Treponema phagedenis TaxID=162 RepID=UPI001C40B67B|nr:extracellular solute-binding protein [Treponema phagedenis]
MRICFGAAVIQAFAITKICFRTMFPRIMKMFFPAYQNTTGFITPYTLDGSCLLINTNLVKAPITGYADLLNPEYKGKISSADPSNSSSAFAQLTNILLAMGGYEDAKAWEFVKDLYRNVDGKIKGSSSGVYKAVADGEMSIGLTYEDPSVSLEQSGAPVKIIFPSEGSVFLPAGSAIVKDAKHLSLAQKFIDFIISEECQNNFAETTSNRPVIKNGKTPKGMKEFSQISCYR